LGEPHAAYDGPRLLDLEFGEGATLRVAPELADPVGTVEVGSMRTEKLGAGSRSESVEELP
jgi:hypothetical protein